MPVSWLRSVSAEITFDERPYGLGESIGVKVRLSAGRAAEIREARLDLVCEERYAQSYTVNVPSGPPTDYGSPWGQFGVYRPPRMPKQVNRDERDSFIHSSAVFLEGARLNAGTVQQLSFLLHVEDKPPPHSSVGSSQWWLEVVLDLAKSRDVRTRRRVDVVAPSADRQARLG